MVTSVQDGKIKEAPQKHPVLKMNFLLELLKICDIKYLNIKKITMNSTHHIAKAEIHVHLEATITPDLCRKFASKNNVNLPDNIFGNKYAYEWIDFYDFIKKYDLVTSVYIRPKIIVS